MNFPIFLIYTFKEPELLSRTCAKLYPAQVYVHVDAKVDIGPFRAALARNKNVELIEERVKVNWAGWSQVVAIRRLVKAAIKKAAPNDYVVLLSGQCYPLHGIEKISSFFSANSPTQYLRCFEINGSEPHYQKQIFRRHFRDLIFLNGTSNVLARRLRTFMIRAVEKGAYILPRPSVPKNVVLAHGPTHFAIQAWCLEKLESMVDRHVESFFKNVFCPEEKFYQSLIASSSLVHMLPSGQLDPYVGRGNWRYANFHHIHPSLTKIYTLDDLDEVLSSKALFLRKLEIEASRELIEKIDERSDDFNLNELASVRPETLTC